jgi:WD40 repeat protein
MVRFFRDVALVTLSRLALPVLLSITAVLAVPALANDDTALYDRPVLVVDPGAHTSPIRQAAVDAAGSVVVTSANDGTLRWWSLADGHLLNTARMPQGLSWAGQVSALAVSPSGDLVAVSAMTDDAPKRKSVYLFNRAGWMMARLHDLPDGILALAFSPDGGSLAAALLEDKGRHPKGSLRIFDRACRRPEYSPPQAGSNRHPEPG